MKYKVSVNVYVKSISTYKTFDKVFKTQKKAIKYIRTFSKINSWESITLLYELK